MKTLYLIIVIALAVFAVAYIFISVLTRLVKNRQTKCKLIRAKLCMAIVGLALCTLHFFLTFFYPEKLYWFLIGILGGVYLFREYEIDEMRLENLER